MWSLVAEAASYEHQSLYTLYDRLGEFETLQEKQETPNRVRSKIESNGIEMVPPT